METKKCTWCGEEKQFSEFYPNKRVRDGRQAHCKRCHCEATAKWVKSNPQKVAAAKARYVERHPERRAASIAKWLKNNPEKRKAVAARWVRDNPEKQRDCAEAWRKSNMAKMAAVVARRRARQLQATPAWANEFFIEEAYELAKLRTEVTGFRWEVDHIVPLVSKKVCGLHTEQNLQVVPRKVNRSKNNRYWPDMPEQGVQYGHDAASTN